jgi:beta-glucosidase-like glycosyl hydrolase
MTAHILIPRIDAASPASLSSELLQAILRKQLAFDGIILADDLGMGAIARHYKIGESVVKTLQAGTDIAMLCHDWTIVAPALEAVAEALSGTEHPAKIDASLTAQCHVRIEQLRHRLCEIEKVDPPPLDVIGCREHHALAAEIRTRIDEVNA